MQTLGNLINDISQTSGMARILSVQVLANEIIDDLPESFSETLVRSGEAPIPIADLNEAQSVVLYQVLLYDWRRSDPKCENREKQEYWSRILAQNPQITDVPGLEEDLKRFCQQTTGYLLDTAPKTATEVAKELRYGYPPEDTLSLFWLGDEAPKLSIPPGHRFWHSLSVKDKGQWGRLSKDEQLHRITRLMATPHGQKKWSGILFRLAHKSLDRGTEKSISDERIVPFEAPVDDPRWNDYKYRQVDEKTGYAHVEPQADPVSDRFISDLETQDDLLQLDRMVAQLRLTDAERIVYQGLRQGKEDTELRAYVQERGYSPASAPVCKTHLLAKIRKANLTTEYPNPPSTP